MPRKPLKTRIPWEDRFERPDLARLTSGLLRQQAQLILHARDAMLSMGSVGDSIVWLGIPWRWALAFAIDGDRERPWAYIIPQPGKPVLALPLSTDMLAAIDVRKLSRTVRDGLLQASRVGDGYWPQWALTSRPQLDEILQIVRRKHELMLSATA
jgi:hypothetical protein